MHDVVAVSVVLQVMLHVACGNARVCMERYEYRGHSRVELVHPVARAGITVS